MLLLARFLVFFCISQYQCKQLTGKSRLRNDLQYVDWDKILLSQSFTSRSSYLLYPAVRTLSDDRRLTSVAYIGPKSRTERPRKTKIGTEVAHVTGD